MLTVVAPVYVLMPLRLCAPVPVLTSESVPAPFWRMPAKLVVPLLPPVVSVAAVALPFVTMPPVPASEPRVRL